MSKTYANQWPLMGEMRLYAVRSTGDLANCALDAIDLADLTVQGRRSTTISLRNPRRRLMDWRRWFD